MHNRRATTSHREFHIAQLVNGPDPGCVLTMLKKEKKKRWTPHSSLEEDSSINHSRVSHRIGCLDTDNTTIASDADQ